jgi:hypothetical protein
MLGVTELSVAVMVTACAVVPETEVVYVPFPWSVTGPMRSPGSLEEKLTASPHTGFPLASVTVAVAVVEPPAWMLLGDTLTATSVASPQATMICPSPCWTPVAYAAVLMPLPGAVLA